MQVKFKPLAYLGVNDSVQDFFSRKEKKLLLKWKQHRSIKSPSCFHYNSIQGKKTCNIHKQIDIKKK